MKHYMFWADWKKPHRRKELQSKNSRPKDEPGVKKEKDADNQGRGCGVPPDAIALPIFMICGLILVFYPVFTRPDAFFKVNQSTVVNKESGNRNAYHQQENGSSFGEDPVNANIVDNVRIFGVENGHNGEKHGLSGGNGSKGELPPRPFGVTEPPCFFGTAVLGGLIIRWDVAVVDWSVPKDSPVLNEAADDFGTLQVAPNDAITGWRE